MELIGRYTGRDCFKGMGQRDVPHFHSLQSYDFTITDSNLAYAKVKVPMATVISTTIHALYTYHTHLASKRNILHDTFNDVKKKRKYSSCGMKPS